MKRIFTATLLLMAVVFSAASASTDAAWPLESWFRVVFKAHVFQVNQDTGHITTRDMEIISYIKFTQVGAFGDRGAMYDLQFWCKGRDGTWRLGDQPRVVTSGLNNNIFPWTATRLCDKRDGEYYVHFTARVSRDARKITISGLIYSGKSDDGKRLYGWFTASGTSAKSIPFSEWGGR
jgi:hypothetical protein